MTRIQRLKSRLYRVLRRSEKYTKTDMVYLVSGSFWLNVNKAVANVSGIVFTIAFANLLPPETFGTFKYVLSALGFATAFSLSGVGTALVRSLAQGKTGFIHGTFRACVRYSFIGSVISAVVSAYYVIQGNAVLGGSFFLIAAALPFLGSFGGMSKGIFEGKKDFRGAAYFGIFRNTFVTALMVAVLLLTKNALAVITAYFIVHTSSAVIGYAYSTKRNRIDTEGREPESSAETVRYAKHMSVLGFFSIAANEADKLLLWHFAGPVQLATYTFALAPVREIRNALENTFALALPKFAGHSLAAVRASMPGKMAKMLVFNIPVIIAYIFVAPYFFKTVFPQYTDAIWYSQLLILVLLFQPKGFIRTSFTAHAKIKEQYAFTITDAVIRMASYLVLIPMYGILGIIFAHLLAEATSFALLVLLLKRAPAHA